MSDHIPAAWAPLTPRGVAGFAMAPAWRLLLAQLVVAILASSAVVWFLAEEWFPVTRTAISQLPAQGEIRGGHLNWPGDAPVKLAGNLFLDVTVDPAHTGRLMREAQLRIEFGSRDLWIETLAGVAVVEYPLTPRFPFNRTELAPWWGAWSPAVLALAGIAVFFALLISWTLLATLYCPVVKLITLFENRDLTWLQSWRLGGAALMPGALFLIFGIVFYGLTAMGLIQLGVVWGLHLVIGWIYLFLSPLFLPVHSEAVGNKGNPFRPKKGAK